MKTTQMKITKATVKRINAHSKLTKEDSYVDQIGVLADILNRSLVLLGEGGCYELNVGQMEEYDIPAPSFPEDGYQQFISGRTGNEWEKRVVAGLAQRYPNWISGTFTHGNNGVDIYDLNKLVKAIIDEN